MDNLEKTVVKMNYKNFLQRSLKTLYYIGLFSLLIAPIILSAVDPAFAIDTSDITTNTLDSTTAADGSIATLVGNTLGIIKKVGAFISLLIIIVGACLKGTAGTNLKTNEQGTNFIKGGVIIFLASQMGVPLALEILNGFAGTNIGK